MNVWDAETGELLGTYDGHKGAVQAFDVTPESDLLITGSADTNLRIYDVFTGELLLEHRVGAVVRFVAWAHTVTNGKHRFVTANDKWAAGEKIAHAVTIWEFDSANKSVHPILKISDKLPMRAMQVRWDAFDEQIVTIHEEGTIFVWNATNGEEVKQIEAHKRAINKIQFSADGKLAITASADLTAKLWETKDWTLVRTYVADRPLNDATISPIWRGTDLKREHILVGGGQEARDVTTTALQEGKFEAVLYHLIQEQELGKVKGHFGPLHTISWMPNGRGFATGSEDGFVRLHKLDAEYFRRKWE